MGRLVMHEWGRLLALTSGTYTAWATLWAFAYRKFFWDFVGGELVTLSRSLFCSLLC